MTDFAIDVRDLRMSYGSVVALRGVDMQVHRGEIFALLGPNGAGKTTTIEILEGFLSPTEGRVKVLGHDPADRDRRFRETIGIVLQETEVEPFLTVEESIELMRSFYDRPLSLDDVLTTTGLNEQRGTRAARLSGGQQRRLDIAMGLAGDPQLLFLDEPTTGFDPHARREAWQMIRELKNAGKTVLLTSHYMDEVENVADRAAIMIDGKIVAEGTPQALAAEAKTTITFIAEHIRGLPDALAGALRFDGSVYRLTTADPTEALHQLTGWAIANEIVLNDLNIQRRSLEDAFVEIATDESSIAP